ncbi:expressed unknown protein [Seminavis robusta]|uniref:BZIP domain-containing protein n=1 Tax=Seminavis robusta TaxID=568900 RepID=A0A9N8EHI4_9STRA|nr:expressed unknown protein [Seminavis robusta]|eukprot:Sro961_g224940.1 n/a (676) ;mRNA; r:5404-7628
MTASEPSPEQATSTAGLPAIPTSSDLFEGELFSDELIDIYHAAVQEGSGPDKMAQENEIPSLPVQPHEPEKEVATDDAASAANVNHPGARVAATAAALDNGLAPFSAPGPFVVAAPPATTSQVVVATATPNPVVVPATATPNPIVVPAAATPNPVVPAAAEAPPIQVVVNDPISNNTVASPAASIPVAKGNIPSDSLGPKRKPETDLQGSAPKKQQQSPSVAATPISVASSITAAAKQYTAATAGATAAKALTSGSTAGMPPKTVTSDGSVASSKKMSDGEGPESAPRAATEADFKTVAQAAVSSLILSTKNGEVPAGNPDGCSEDIDLSTDHIKNLTGSNWVAACAGAGAAAVAAGGGSAPIAEGGKAGNRKRQNLTADERARQNRDRNREHGTFVARNIRQWYHRLWANGHLLSPQLHVCICRSTQARNTRLRKKAYVEELKRTLTELVAQRDRTEQHNQQTAQREVEQREVRFRVIEEFLKLRARNEANQNSWAAILHSSFVLTMPCDAINRRTTTAQGTVPLEHIFSGADGVMRESNNFATFLQSVRSDANEGRNPAIVFQYYCDRTNFFMDDDRAVLDWSANTSGLVERGLQRELSIRGSIRAEFCPASNKLLSASMVFDTGAILSQLNQFIHVSAGTAYYAEAQEASHRANAILDSLQMPHLATSSGGA